MPHVGMNNFTAINIHTLTNRKSYEHMSDIRNIFFFKIKQFEKHNAMLSQSDLVLN